MFSDNNANLFLFIAIILIFGFCILYNWLYKKASPKVKLVIFWILVLLDIILVLSGICIVCWSIIDFTSSSCSYCFSGIQIFLLIPIIVLLVILYTETKKVGKDIKIKWNFNRNKKEK